LGQGRENAKEFLNQNPEFLAQIEAQIRANAASASGLTHLGGSAMPSTESSEEGSELEEE
jgi:hypothetical protein